MKKSNALRPELRAIVDHLKDHEPTQQEVRRILDELSPLAGDKPLFGRSALQRFGRSGGMKLKRTRGAAYYKRIGKMGGRPPKKKGKR